MVEDNEPVIIDQAVYRRGERLPCGDISDELAELQARGDDESSFLWIGLKDPTADEFEHFARELELHPLAVEDALKGGQRPKFEIYGHMAFVVMRTLRYIDESSDVETGELMAFVGPHFVVTVRRGEPAPLEQVRSALEHDPTMLEKGPMAVLYSVMDAVVDRYRTIDEELSDDVVAIDQGAIKGSRRSNPATYTGLLEPIRKAFAKANGVKPALFSANSEGACEACKGAGVIYTDLGIMETVETPCDVCEGKRFKPEVLEYELGGKNIADVLGLSVADALAYFRGETSDGAAKVPAAVKVLERLDDVGLGYVKIGQPLTTLSGGERQRLKLATHMGDKGGTYILDEPTTGPHLADVEQLLSLLDSLVDAGKNVIVIEHHQAVMAHADWIIDLGPGAGHDGGRVVFTGTPAQMAAERSTLTGKYLAQYVEEVNDDAPE